MTFKEEGTRWNTEETKNGTKLRESLNRMGTRTNG